MHAAGAVAVRTVRVQVRPHAMLHRGRHIRNRREMIQSADAGLVQRRIKKPKVVPLAQLVVRHRMVGRAIAEIPVKLSCFYAQDVASRWRVAANAVGLAGIRPGLRPRAAVAGPDRNLLIYRFTDDIGVAVVVAPLIGDPIGRAGRVQDEQPGLQPPADLRVALVSG